jgi:hypothetical protein
LACQNRVCSAACGPANCDGCCRNDNTCAPGIANNACGVGGALCENCANQKSFCNGLVTPRRCNSEQTSCPAAYGACAPSVQTPVTPPLQGVCLDVVLDGIATACAAGVDAASCSLSLALLPPACSKCLDPFKQPFERHAGLWACAASFVDDACRRQTGCAADCGAQSCAGCESTTENQCYALVSGSANQCGSLFRSASCADKVLDSGELCSQFSYANYGKWLRAVGDHFCGNGP